MTSLFDLHCDTPTYLFDHGNSLRSSGGHISLEKAAVFTPYHQVAAIWQRANASNDELYRHFLEVVDAFRSECELNNCRIIRTAKELLAADEEQRAGFSPASFLLSIEDCRFLDSPQRLETAYDRGIRILTPLWAGSGPLGGAHDSKQGLTPLGQSLLRDAAQHGMILDVSHASIRSTFQIIEIASTCGAPVIASHSNCAAFYPHSRNLTHEGIRALIEAGGIIGASLCPYHLAEKGASVREAAENIALLSIAAGKNSVALGCDFDGTELPAGMTDLKSISALDNALAVLGWSQSEREALFYQNAYKAMYKYLQIMDGKK